MSKRRMLQRWTNGFGWAGLLLFTPILGAQSQESRLQADKADSLIGYELVGQVQNISAQSLQYGYLNFVRGLPRISTQAGTISEATALLTFYNDTTTERVINNGSIRIVDRTGTGKVYFDGLGFATFSNPDTFRDGNAVQVCSLRHQVVLDTSTGYFTVTFEMVVSAAETFQIDGNAYKLGQPGDAYRIKVAGKLAASSPPTAQIAGVATGVGAEVSQQQH